MNELTAEWVEKAEDDFASADVLLHAGEFPIPDTACFHCQQSAEKYLKAYLQEYQVKFERRHDLIPLLDLCVSVDKDFSILKNDLQVLDRAGASNFFPLHTPFTNQLTPKASMSVPINKIRFCKLKSKASSR
jgi:HEPN domain-containing protein